MRYRETPWKFLFEKEKSCVEKYVRKDFVFCAREATSFTQRLYIVTSSQQHRNWESLLDTQRKKSDLDIKFAVANGDEGFENKFYIVTLRFEVITQQNRIKKNS